MTTQKITFIKVFETYLIYSKAFIQYNQLDEEDKKIIKPYIERLNRRWREELEYVNEQCKFSLLKSVKLYP